jgi:hypothetical protein
MIFNAMIFYYGLDKLYSFNKALDQSRLNLFLAVLKWGWRLVGSIEPHFLDSESLWGKYVAAWLETLLPGDDFYHREDFLETWRTSKYDLVWFTKSFKVTMAKEMHELGAGKPLVDSPADFMKKCAQKKISPAKFKRIGPSVATHYLFEQHKKKQERKEKDQLAAEMVLSARASPLQGLLAAKAMLPSEDDDDDFDKPLWFPGWEDDYEEQGDAMDVDPAGYPVPEGVDLTRVPWDADWMQALLNIDKGLKFEGRPESDRIPWIGQEESLRALYPKEAELADDLNNILKLW